MKESKSIKNMIFLAIPLILFAGLYIPYSWANQQFIVKWFGCGCPVIDEAGNMIESNFNANDFTALFWLFVVICVTILAIFLSKRIIREKILLRIGYVVGVLVLSLIMAYNFFQMMMWN